MITWESKQVAEFLNAEPGIEESQFSDTQFTFEFSVADLLARLVVYPRDCDVWLRLFPRESDAEVAAWRFCCDRILFQGEMDEDGGSTLVFHARLPDDLAARPRPAAQWLVIGRRAKGFGISSFFMREKGAYP